VGFPTSALLSAVANRAAQILGVLDSGEALSTQQWTDALAYGNNMVDNWSVDDVMLLQDTRYVGALTASTQAYTIGTGGTFNTTRPVAIVAGSLLLPNGPGSMVKFCNAKEWAEIEDRQGQSWKVRYGFYDRQNVGGLGNVYFSPVPFGGSVELLMLSALPQFVDINTTALTFPGPGYADLYCYGMALRMAADMSVPVPASAMDGWNQASQRIRLQNAKLWGELPPELRPTGGK
jgi:hypothetical protein